MISLNRLDRKINRDDTAGVLDDLYGRIADRFAGHLTDSASVMGDAQPVQPSQTLEEASHEVAAREPLGRLPLPLRVRLINAPAGAWALALDRVLGMTYGTSDLIEDLVRRIEDEVAIDTLAGECFGYDEAGDALGDETSAPDPAVWACIAAAACRLIAEDRPGFAPLVGRMSALRDRALVELAECQDESGLLRGDLDRTQDDALLTTAFAASLLAGAAEARMALCWSSLLGALEENEHRIPAAARPMARAATSIDRAVGAACDLEGDRAFEQDILRGDRCPQRKEIDADVDAFAPLFASRRRGGPVAA